MNGKTREKSDDPLLYASLLGSLLQGDGGWRFFGGDLAHWVVNFRKNRQMTRERIAQLQGQVSRAERLIEEAQIKTTGRQLDKWR